METAILIGTPALGAVRSAEAEEEVSCGADLPSGPRGKGRPVCAAGGKAILQERLHGLGMEGAQETWVLAPPLP